MDNGEAKNAVPQGEPVNEPQDPVATIIITTNIRTGGVKVAGNIAHKYLALQTLIVAAKLIMDDKNIQDLTYVAEDRKQIKLGN